MCIHANHWAVVTKPCCMYTFRVWQAVYTKWPNLCNDIECQCCCCSSSCGCHIGNSQLPASGGIRVYVAHHTVPIMSLECAHKRICRSLFGGLNYVHAWFRLVYFYLYWTINKLYAHNLLCCRSNPFHWWSIQHCMQPDEAIDKLVLCLPFCIGVYFERLFINWLSSCCFSLCRDCSTIVMCTLVL